MARNLSKKKVISPIKPMIYIRKIFVTLRNLYYRVFRKRTLGVVAVLLRDNEVCLVRHSYMPDWYLPGGGINQNETPYDAVIREIKEECGIKIKDAELMNVYSHFKGGWNNFVICYKSTEFDDIANAKLDPEIAEARFFKISDLPPNIRSTAKRRITEALQASPQNPLW